MKSIGFIDRHIDEYHADKFPQFIRESALGDRYRVTHAWAETTPPGKKPLDQWCQEQGIAQAASIEQIVDECDCIVVLSPDNVERHEDLSRLSLMSGKPVFIDKPFVDSLAAGQRIIELARQHNTPMFSCSALRFASAAQRVQQALNGPAEFACSRGPGKFQIYAVHQLEMLIMALGTGAERVMHCGHEKSLVMMIDYADGRRGMMQHGFDFGLWAKKGDDTHAATDINDYFPRFIDAMLRFFETGASPVPEVEMLEMAALLEAGERALRTPDRWVDVPR